MVNTASTLARTRFLLEGSAHNLLAAGDLSAPFNYPGQPEGRFSRQLATEQLGRVSLAVIPEKQRRLVTQGTLGRCAIWVLQSVGEQAGDEGQLEVVRILRSLPPRLSDSGPYHDYPFFLGDSEIEASAVSEPGITETVRACRQALRVYMLSVAAEVSVATINTIANDRQ